MKLNIKVKKASGLAAKDSNGKSDPYCKVFIDKKRKFQTKTLKATLEPTWDETCTLDVVSGESLHIEVWDWDRVGSDDIIGSATVPLTDLTDEGVERWIDLSDKSKSTGKVQLVLSLTGKGSDLKSTPSYSSSSTTSSTSSGTSVSIEAEEIVDGMKLETGKTYVVDTSKSSEFKVALSWEILSEHTVDLDACCIILDKNGNYLESCYFACPKCQGGMMKHSGDSTDGKAEGDDEYMLINLVDMPPDTHVFYFVVNSYSGDNFLAVETATAKLYNSKGVLISQFNLACKGGDSTAMLVIRVFRHPTDFTKWLLSPVGIPVKVRSFAELVPEAQKHCRDIFPKIVISPPPKSIVLTKGESIKLDSKIQDAIIGLGWDFVSKSIDLDASVVAFGSKGEVLGKAYYGNKVILDGKIKHAGDNTSGKGEGDDEQIAIKLGALPTSVTAVGVCVTSFRGDKFTSIRGAFVRLVSGTSTEVARYNLSNLGSYTAYVMAFFIRSKDGWNMKAIGLPGKGKTVDDCTDVMKYLSLGDETSEASKSAQKKFHS